LWRPDARLFMRRCSRDINETALTVYLRGDSRAITIRKGNTINFCENFYTHGWYTHAYDLTTLLK